jgi:hypothetical protein
MSELDTNAVEETVVDLGESQDAEQVEVEASDELVENEVGNEGISEDADTEVTEAKKEDEKEEVEETAPAFKTPNTKAGVINAAVEMLKKAKKT